MVQGLILALQCDTTRQDPLECYHLMDEKQIPQYRCLEKREENAIYEAKKNIIATEAEES